MKVRLFVIGALLMTYRRPLLRATYERFLLHSLAYSDSKRFSTLEKNQTLDFFGREYPALTAKPGCSTYLQLGEP